MASSGAQLQNYNNDLVMLIEDLREQRAEVVGEIARDEQEKVKIENDLRILNERLARINETMARKVAARNEYERTIAEAEAAYSKVYLRRRRPKPRGSPNAAARFFSPLAPLARALPRQILESSQTLLNVLKRESSVLASKN